MKDFQSPAKTTSKKEKEEESLDVKREEQEKARKVPVFTGDSIKAFRSQMMLI